MAAIPPFPAPAPKITGLEGPMAVVGPQFCVPYDVELIVTEKVMAIDDASASVKDANGNVVLKLKGRLLGIHEKRRIHDAHGVCIITVQKKIRTVRDRWNMYRGDSTDEKDLICTVRSANYIQVTAELHMFLPSNTSEKTCDFKVKKGYNNRQLTFYLGDTDKVIAQINDRENMKTKLLEQDSYGLTVYTNMDYAFIVAVSTIIDAGRDAGYKI